MKLFFKNIIIILLLVIWNIGMAQEKRPSYQYPKDPAVLQSIANWQDLKFGLFIHWGSYSQWGIVESWSICPEDEDWCIPDTVKEYFHYKKQYENLGKTFNPTKFDPEKWAKAAKNAGMKYVVFTTKHHDGFCMFDSKYTDYKITGKDCPFHTNPKADVTKEIFNAFRNEGLWIGAYFSKPDWHSNDYWWPQFPPLDRNVNYDPAKYPERWNNFVNFTHNQVMEICSNYGKIDLMWFDGGWVQKHPDKGAAPEAPGFTVKKMFNQDIKMDELVEKIRSKQPVAIVVDRAVEGKNQNYLTPENQVPDKILPYPWESCMTMGNSWSYKPGDNYKTVHDLVQMLVPIVSRGGNFLLNIGSGPEGDFIAVAYERLEGIGDWMKINSEAIYKTKPISPYYESKLVFTQKDQFVYAFYLPDKDEKIMPAKVAISSMQAVKGCKLFLLGYGRPLKWEPNGKGMIISIPQSLQTKPVCHNAWVFKFQI